MSDDDDDGVIDVFQMEFESGMPNWLSPEGKRWARDPKFREQCLKKRQREIEKGTLFTEETTPSFKKFLNRPTPKPETIAKRQKVTLTQVKKAIRKGIGVEKEHTKKKAVAHEIASDHVAELGPGYYKALDKMEKGLKKKK